MSRLTSVKDALEQVTSYRYDVAGNRTSISATIGDKTFTTFYTHDALNRIETVTDPNGGVYEIDYTATGEPERLEYPNGVVTTKQYDSQGRLTDLVTRNPANEMNLDTPARN